MSREMTNKEAISNLNHIYGIVSSDIQRSLDLAIRALEERPQGEWIKKGIYFECPFCHCACNSIIIDRIVFGKLNYCPNCGAHMKGGAEC